MIVVGMKKKTPRTPRGRLKIELQETIKEVQTKSYEIVRLSRVKYVGNDYCFVDMRFFQRSFDERENELYHPTKKGVQLREDLFRALVDEHFLKSLERQIDEPDS